MHGTLVLFKTWPVLAHSGVTTPSTRENAASHSSGCRGYLLDFRESYRASPGVHGGRRGAQRGSRILPHVHARARRTIGREAASGCCCPSRHHHAHTRARWWGGELGGHPLARIGVAAHRLHDLNRSVGGAYSLDYRGEHLSVAGDWPTSAMDASVGRVSKSSTCSIT